MADMTASAVRERFDVKWQYGNDGLLITLIPKDPREARRCNRLDLTLDLSSWEFMTQRYLDPAGHETIFAFDHADFNTPPADRDSLLLPDLRGFQPLTWPLEPAAKPAP